MKYQPRKIEKKWQKYWEEKKTFKDYSKKEKFYALDMFPYPSGSGLHVGHPKGYIATDISARFEILRGKSVLHPMGWDAFGLPAENYAIKNKIHPSVAVKENIKKFKEQLRKIGFTYDWDREINTTDPKYYRFTQWIFLKMFEKGLAYESYEPINWCPGCKTGLANEDLENGLCERCGSEIEQKPMRQWVLKMTEYADRLLEDLDIKDLDWEKSIIDQQKNWIGRSEGVVVKFPLSIEKDEATKQSKKSAYEEGINSQKSTHDKNFIEVFTTRVDTIFGCTYIVVAPEHPLMKSLSSCSSRKEKTLEICISNLDEVKHYIEQAKKKTVMQRTELAKEKTGVELKGVRVINPFNGESVPVFVADYVLGSYGTGAVMAVPSHDDRDFEFAKKYNLPLRQSVAILFSDLEGKDAVRKDAETVRRRTAFAFLKHWSEDAYLCLDWEKFGWHSGIIGGVEDKEQFLDTAKREIIEETGYQNPEFVRFLGGEIHTHFYAAHKGINRYAEGRGMVFQLKNDKWKSPKEEETLNHKAVWITGDKMKSFLNLENFEYMWEILCGKKSECFTGEGVLVDSGEFTGLSSQEAREKMTKWLEKKENGKRTVNYKMRDWVFSRQRYWGEPIPIIHCKQCRAVGVPEEQLPVILPDVNSYEPTGTGESPLSGIESWVNTVCPKCGGPAKRETNTMPQWAGSSWYYLSYIVKVDSEFQFSNSSLYSQWLPVDLYVGGAEHATRHLLYARFWHKFLYDIGIVPTKEPFKKLVHVGLINAADGRKMSKRWNNVINPDDVVAEFGADSLRLYEMFMGPFTQKIAWNTEGVSGVRRFLEKVWRLGERVSIDNQLVMKDTTKNLLHKTIKKVTEDIENFRFNTAISSLMILSHDMEKEKELPGELYKIFLLLLSPFAPHIAEELWEKMGHKTSIFLESWPEYSKENIQDAYSNFVFQVNGKTRDILVLKTNISEEEIKNNALSNQKVQKFIEGKEIRKIIFVKGKLINIVV
ncbi:MAG: class I tRNA ligase family protein [Candidatus Moraniibacteriota bacterium]|nr:MAG: class I tRNA ligase family protein [Candidatus Moranbacteria bacterium]